MSVINWGSVMVIFISLPYSPVELSTCLNMCVCDGKPNAIEFAAISSLQHQLPSQSRLPGHCSSQGKYPMNTFALSRLIQYWIYTQLTVFACSLSLSYSVGWAGWDWSSCCTGPSDQCSLTQSSIQQWETTTRKKMCLVLQTSMDLTNDIPVLQHMIISVRDVIFFVGH